MKRRRFLTQAVIISGGICAAGNFAWAETFLTPDQARTIIWGSQQSFSPLPVELTKDQRKAIAKASKVRVRSSSINAWISDQNNWFIVDQVIGKHENIDIAVGLTSRGEVQGIEILTYRESYGHQVRNAKWRSQFHGKTNSQHLRLGKEIKNISGATLSCRHVTDGINRLTHTWSQVLQSLQK